MGMIGRPGDAPTVNRGGQGDRTTSMTALAATLAALRQRDQTGEAQFVDIALQRTGVYTLAGDIQQQLGGLPARPRQDRTKQRIVTWNPYRTRDDRWLMLVMVNPERYWNRFARCLEREDLVDDARYTTIYELQKHGAALIPELDAIFATRDLEEWGARLDEHELLWAAVASVPEVIADPQLAQYDAFPQVPTTDGTSYRVVGVPFEIVGAEVGPRGPAPAIGQNTADVLSEGGFSDDEVATLAAERVFG
jgi:crotonobetainyl-CoA:carnitine CoA-transferase CaiB-like acyl-CoA transferase